MQAPDAPPGDAPLVEEGLLAAIAAEADAAAPRLVYADWLQSRGDPRGELIIVQHELRARPADEELLARERELVERAVADLAVPGLRREVIGRWALGFVDELMLSGRELAVLRRIAPGWLARPALRMVRQLDVTLRKPGGFRSLAASP
ncbi:MAG TPA: TIGR02996 domain-containing protein, partial [Kofleriaceae bacterium]|nr:TIGR02996 domain-containing protein [Kofleriaceae bacterium]